jgi:hypothetical protein
VPCSRCGEETSDRDHPSVQDCLDFLRLSVTHLNLYVARAELGAEAARRRAEVLMSLLQEIADAARPELDPAVLPDLVRRIRKLALGQVSPPGKPSVA